MAQKVNCHFFVNKNQFKSNELCYKVSLCENIDVLMHHPKELAKKVLTSRIGSRLRAFQRAIDEVRTLPLTPPKGGSKSEFVVYKQIPLYFRNR